MKTYPLKPLSLVLLIFGFSTTVSALDGDAERGQAAAAVCTACHQADGNGLSIPGAESWPRLAGLDAAYMYKQLQDFNSGQRENASMAPFAAMLNDQQMQDVAVYFSQLMPNVVQGADDADEALLKQGERLATLGDWSRYIPSCQSCHGPDNQGAGENFPGIAGQHAGYLQAQLHNWQQDKRRNDPQHLMLAIAERLNDEDIKAVAAWLSVQPAK
ncbi:c-type cytochrome [Nitrincola sp.]|uniref:c-type cytochrome n=1 Tax=Nitrincola sp. TaxID=1926584 RepID=UPI003A95449B